MKSLNTFFLLLALSVQIHAQVGIGTTSPDGSSALDIVSDDSGLLIPRMTELERDAISNPATSLLIFQTNNTSGFYYFNGTSWIPFGGGDTDWIATANDMYNGNSGNIGIGNTSPSAKLHLSGTTIPGSSGGLATIYQNDFSSGTISYIANPGNTCTTGINVWNINANDAFLNSCVTCSGDRAMIQYSGTCVQNQTLVEGSFIPTQSSIDISFNYGYNDFSGFDSFVVTLYNETTNSVAATILNLTSDDEDASYSSSETVSPGDSYSLRFTYVGDDDVGASVDDILVTETGVASSGDYVLRLEDGQQQAGYVLTSDADGNATWEPLGGASSSTDDQTLSISGNQLSIEDGNTVTLPSGGSGNYTFENGLTEIVSNVRLGGSLIVDTTIALDDNELTFTTNSGAVLPGDVIFEGGSRDVMETNLEDNYVNFGGGFPLVDADDGSAFLDSGGSSFTKDFVAGFDAGGTGGSAIAMGSIEYFVDGTDELFFEGSGFSPMDDETSQFGNTLGKSNRRWGAVYATNGVITTSDESYKKDILDLNYGLKELLKINAISYKWRDQSLGRTIIPENFQQRKIGFSAQQLQTVIPEVVTTHSWVPADEEGNFKRIKNEKLGVNYSDIIPVVVNAIKEQQNEIDDLRRMIIELQKQNKVLMQNQNKN